MAASWTPSPADIKAVIPQRLDGEAFSATTVPTVDQVEGIISDLVGEVVGEVGPFDPTVVLNPNAPADDQITLGALAKRAATLGTASQIEDSFFPEQQTPVGAYGVEQDGGNQHLYARYRRSVDLLRRHVDAIAGTAQEFSGSIGAPLTTVAGHGRIRDTP
jgi:hypothetical protein